MKRAGVLVLGFIALLGGTSNPASGDIHVALLPADNQVDPSEIFDLELTIPEAGNAFNGYEITIEFDASLLTFISRPPSQQEGPLMTGACGTRFHQFNEDNGVITLNHILLCSGTSVTGPGVLYKLRFQAGTALAVTPVQITSVRFANAGVLVLPVLSEDANVEIGSALGVPGEGSGPGQGRLQLPFPNPFRSSVELSFTPARSGRMSLDVFSISGRLVRHLAHDEMQPGTVSSFVWDGRDAWNRPVPPGVYMIRLQTPDGPQSRRLTKIR